MNEREKICGPRTALLGPLSAHPLGPSLVRTHLPLLPQGTATGSSEKRTWSLATHNR